MSARVKVRAAIWVQDKLVVHHSRRMGKERMTLPGGWVGKRESVTDALIREVEEELGITIEVGDLLCAAEVINTASHQDVELIFAVSAPEGLDTSQLTLVDPRGPEADDVLPPVLGQLAERREAYTAEKSTPRWLGNLYLASRGQT
ncbi:MAG TPA: NUDIX domain-containing protein [Solirubrobacteraceae bacterium]|nr:NUDIX domain-containing protein [Solirubrobacteraceae bacterium]